MKQFKKPALTFQKQIDLLKSRGLEVNDEKRAIRHLSNVSYYRMSAYMLPFKVLKTDGSPSDSFIPGTTWDNIYDLYKFDRKLRLLIFDAIERIEVALRTQVIYQLSHKYGSHWQNNASIFKPAITNPHTGKTYDVFREIQTHIKEQLSTNHKMVFIEHYLATYNDPPTPPSWMAVELLYFSELSKICQHLRIRADRTDISKAFGIIDDSIFCSWLHTLNYVRNICAHHARLWNINLDITPSKFYNKTSRTWLTNKEVDNVQSSRIYYTMCLILYLLQTVNPRTKFKIHFKKLLNDYPIVNVGYMGFPTDWEQHPLWK